MGSLLLFTLMRNTEYGKDNQTALASFSSCCLWSVSRHHGKPPTEDKGGKHRREPQAVPRNPFFCWQFHQPEHRGSDPFPRDPLPEGQPGQAVQKHPQGEGDRGGHQGEYSHPSFTLPSPMHTPNTLDTWPELNPFLFSFPEEDLGPLWDCYSSAPFRDLVSLHPYCLVPWDY